MCPHVRQILGSPLPEGEIGLGNFLCGVWNNLLFLELSLLVIFAALKHTDGSILCKMVLMFFLVPTTVNDQIITADVIFIHLGVRTWSNRVNGWSNIQLHSCGDGLLLSLLRKMSLSSFYNIGTWVSFKSADHSEYGKQFSVPNVLCGTRNGMRPTLANPFLSQSLLIFLFQIGYQWVLLWQISIFHWSIQSEQRCQFPRYNFVKLLPEHNAEFICHEILMALAVFVTGK